MFEFTEEIHIAAPVPEVWTTLQDIETWWPASNPEHIALEQLDDRGITAGAKIKIREKVAGIPMEGVGEITRVDPQTAVTWEAPEARYRWLGLSITVGEGVTWSVRTAPDGGTLLGARVRATFPSGVGGRILEWVFSRVLGGVEKDREHARTELRYLKETIETGDAGSTDETPRHASN